ncbi:glycosyltransferase 87 family protein [Larkinella soli]|uniref:glycosyltransferase 87 family protein n=1 Tax=Larkinella soli TaxID=1770527 RepID=UPI0013E361E7|nr:glycosyltransferase 87 family protein [Larkinella soli]
MNRFLKALSVAHPWAVTAVLCAVVLSLACAALDRTFVVHDADLHLYQTYALRVLEGQCPFRDFRVEYPPLALLPMLLPALVRTGDFDIYLRLFFLQNILLLALTTRLVLGLPLFRKGRSGRRRVPAGGYFLLVLISLPHLLLRFDIFPALLTLLAVRAVFRDKPVGAGFWLGLGIAAKLYPVVLLAVAGVYYFGSRQYRSLLRLGGGVGAGLVVSCLPLAVPAGVEIVGFLKYHQVRGLQIESVWSGLLLLGQQVGMLREKIVFNYGAFHLESILSHRLAEGLPVLAVACFTVLTAWLLYRFQIEYRRTGRISQEHLGSALLAVLLLFITVNKVFSPQYLLWLLPFAGFLSPVRMVVLVLIFALTTLLFPFTYNALLTLKLPAVLLLNVRNALTVSLLFSLLNVPQVPSYSRKAEPALK